MIDQQVTRQTTAEEIRARWQEKMQVIGPVVERMIGETHTPAIRRVYNIMARWRGPNGESLFPPMPAAMLGHPMKLSFESILAQAARMGKFANITQWLGIAGNLAGAVPNIMDGIDTDETISETGSILTVPNKLMRPLAQVQAMRKAKADQQAAADRADQAQKPRRRRIQPRQRPRERQFAARQGPTRSPRRKSHMSPLPMEIDLHQRGVAFQAVRPINHRDTRHSNTMSYVWQLSPLDRKGRPMIVASSRHQWSIHSTGPCIIMGTLDEVEWTPVLELLKEGILRRRRPSCAAITPSSPAAATAPRGPRSSCS